MIFSRRRGRAGRDQVEPAQAADLKSEPSGTSLEPESEQAPQQAGGGATGPYDLAQAPSGVQQLDLGALRIPMVDAVEVRVQADPEGRVQQVVLVAGDNGLQLAVLAAPRTESIWDEVREEIRSQLRSDGFASQETTGEFGTELRTRVRTPEGPKDLRFVGISGPRWLVRAIFQGPVALDPGSGPQLVACLHGLVVNRGSAAMPAGEMLPLRLPQEITDQGEAARLAAVGDSDADGDSDAGGGSSSGGGEATPKPTQQRSRPRRR